MSSDYTNRYFLVPIDLLHKIQNLVFHSKVVKISTFFGKMPSGLNFKQIIMSFVFAFQTLSDLL